MPLMQGGSYVADPKTGELKLAPEGAQTKDVAVGGEEPSLAIATTSAPEPAPAAVVQQPAPDEPEPNEQPGSGRGKRS